jgi:hypothetical protein
VSECPVSEIILTVPQALSATRLLPSVGMVLECYFDGANKPTAEHDRVILATACGKPEQWQAFNEAWNDLLEHFPAPPLHTTDAVALRKDFHREGWDHDVVDDFISDAVRVIENHIAYLLPVSKKFTSGLFVATLTIPLWRISCSDCRVSYHSRYARRECVTRHGREGKLKFTCRRDAFDI